MSEIPQDWQRFLAESFEGETGCDFSGVYGGETVLVTGAGGSIGSALVRALGRAGAGSVILLDSSERGLFEIGMHMQEAHPETRCEWILGSVNNPRLMHSVFGRFQPRTVFHAAAVKHVGLLEHNVFTAIENNVLGTHTLVEAARNHGVIRLLLLSTDKSVNPRSVMGVSKRIAELITVTLSAPPFRANAIRLGNVIGSSGSVVPIFLKRIAKGLPVRVTHPQVSRYFFSTGEAVQVLLAAAALGCDGKVLIPEFWAPVKITDLAQFLKALSVIFTGLQPGEKLTEEFISGNEQRIRTAGELTIVETEKLTGRQCQEAVARLAGCVRLGDRAELLRCLCELVPDYVPSEVQQEWL